MTMTPRWLEHAARQSAERLWTLGSALDEYCRMEGLTREQLSTGLGCSVDSLAWLSLCRRPAPDHFAEDISKIAERFQIEASKLAEIVRRVDVVAALRRPVSMQEAESVLLAARDRDGEKDK
jgi:transcriptional regulator with XRE-family HTH domain